jgi:ribonuclease D
MQWQWVGDDVALRQACQQCLAAEAVAVDTEFMRQNTFFPLPALVQLCVQDTAWLIDPLAIQDASPLLELFQSASVVKVLHAVSEDLEVFARWPGALPAPLFDTQKAAALAGMGTALGYRAIVELVCQQQLEKGETRSDWLRRPLTESQCHYAAQDVWYLLPVYRELLARLKSLGRLDWAREDSNAALAVQPQNGEQLYRRIKNAWRLDSEGLSVLEAVANWREQRARSDDKPRSWVIDDAACLAVAQRRPSTSAELDLVSELSSTARRQFGEELLAAVIAGQSAARLRQLPPMPGPLQPEERTRLKRLKGALADCASKLGVEPETLLSTRDLERLLRQPNDVSEPSSWQGWRGREVLPQLRAALQEEQ